MENQEQNTQKQGFDFNSMDNVTKITMGLSLVGVIGCFLPYLTVSISMFGQSVSESANIMKAGFLGIIVLVAFITSLLTPVFGEQLKSAGGAIGHLAPRYSVIAALAALVLQTVMEFSSQEVKLAKEMGADVSLGIGFYLMIAAGLVIALIQFKVIKIK